MRRFASLLWLGTLCACAGGARAGRAPVAPPAVPERAPVPDAPRPVVGAPTAERMVTVPPLVGLDFEAAAAKARVAGLDLMGVRVAGLPAGVVLDQNPAAGRSVPAGARVRVGIASGAVDSAPPAASATAPDLPPAPPPDLPPSVVPEAPPLTVPLAPIPDAPPEGTSTEPLPVPSVLDRTEPVARRILTDAGFRIRIEATESGVKGRVMDQLPSPGDRVPRGSEILLKVPGYVPITAESLGSPDSAPANLEAPVAPPPPPPAPTPPPVPPTPPAAPAAPPPAEAPALPPAPPAPPVATLPPADLPPPAPPATPIPSLDVPPEAPPPSVGTPPEPPPVVVAPPADEPPVPIFAGPGANPGATPAAPPAAPSAAPVVPPVAAPPAVSPDAPVVPAPVTPPAPPPIDDVPVPPSDAVPVPPDAAVPPSDSVPVPPSDAVPVPPPVGSHPPESPPSPTEPGGQPAGPSLPGLEIPKPKSPPSDAQIPIAPSVSVEIAWEPVAGATGYLIELEELVDAAWSPLQRRIVKTSKVLVQVEPSNPTAADVRWRVRSVVGRRGGRPAPWVVFHLR